MFLGQVALSQLVQRCGHDFRCRCAFIEEARIEEITVAYFGKSL